MTLLALLLLAAAASASIDPMPWWLLALIPVWLVSGVIAGRDPVAAMTQPGGDLPEEQHIATIYLRAGRLVLRRRVPRVGRA